MVGNTTTVLGALMKMNLILRGTQDCADVKLEIFVNNKLVVSTSACTDEIATEINLPDTPAIHLVEICMSGKTFEHTQVDDDGNIVSDVAFIIETLKIQDIDMKPVFCQGRQCYLHTGNNPNGALLQDEMYDYIGWNGKVQLEFFTPIYLWMSEYF